MKGFTLIELLVAMALMSMVVSGLMMVYLSLKQNHETEVQLLSVQEDGRFVLMRLFHQLEQTGDERCVKNPNERTALVGYDRQAIPASLKSLKAESDVLVSGFCKKYQGKIQFVKTAYYLAKTNRKTPKGKVILGLYEKPLQGKRQEIIAPVFHLQFRYGIEAKAASAIKNWLSVKGVDINLNNGAVWHAFIALRNRLS